MTQLEKLSKEDIADSLRELEGWTFLEDRNAIRKEFTFKNFRTAWSFMEDVAIEADEMSHHPEWTNAYNKVIIVLTTHDVTGITELDIDLATIIEEIAASDAILTD